jgi:hypothetical protein
VDRDSIGLLLASTLAGLAVLLAVVALARQPFLLLVALPFAVGAYLVWRGATGQFSWGLTGGRFREARRAQERREWERRQGDSRGPFEQARDGGPFQQARRGSRSRSQARQRTTGARRGPGPQERAREALDRREAYRVLGLSPDADAAAVKAAYRKQVKRVHPDADGGDPEAFRRVTAAYETLQK